MSIDVNSTPEQIEAHLKTIPVFQGQDFSIGSVQDFMNLIDGVPPEREEELPEEIISVYNHYSSIELDRQVKPEFDESEPKAKVKKPKPKWDGAGDPFRPGTKYDEVYQMIRNEKSRDQITEFLKQKYGEPTCKPANVSVYINTIFHRLSDFYIHEENADSIKLIRLAR